jgi:hypothetical protein
MIKTRLVWILTVLVALVAVAVILFLTSQNELSLRRARVEQLPEGQAILGNARPELQSVQKGDAFLYMIEVLYDLDQISEIDRDSLDDNVNLDPFEVRNTKETEFNLGSGMRVYQRQYEIQLIGGETEQLYEFPTIVIRYELKGADGFADTSVTPEPVYVASRIPDDVSGIIEDLELGGDAPLKPLAGEIEDADKNRLPWIFWSIGGLMAALAVADLTFRVIPRWREQEKQARKTKMSEILCQAYRSLKENIEAGAKPDSLLHQMDHILRLVLTQKGNSGWLEEPDLDIVPEGIKPSVISLFGRYQKVYEAEDIEQKEVDEALKELENILNFYFAGEIEVWRS